MTGDFTSCAVSLTVYEFSSAGNPPLFRSSGHRPADEFTGGKDQEARHDVGVTPPQAPGL
jgi:hypothetical protein